MSMAELEMMAQNQIEAEAEAEVEAEMSLTDGGTLAVTTAGAAPAHLWMCQCEKQTKGAGRFKRAVPFEVLSNRRKRSCHSISDGMYLEIRIKKCCISNPPVFAFAMIRVFPSFEHSTGVSANRRQF